MLLWSCICLFVVGFVTCYSRFKLDARFLAPRLLDGTLHRIHYRAVIVLCLSSHARLTWVEELELLGLWLLGRFHMWQ